MTQKAHITLSIPNEIYDRIRRHPEVKWSQAARQGILEKLGEIEGLMKSSDFFASLSDETKKGIEEISAFSQKDWKEYYKKMKEKEWKRKKSSTRTS